MLGPTSPQADPQMLGSYQRFGSFDPQQDWRCWAGDPVPGLGLPTASPGPLRASDSSDRLPPLFPSPNPPRIFFTLRIYLNRHGVRSPTAKDPDTSRARDLALRQVGWICRWYLNNSDNKGKSTSPLENYIKSTVLARPLQGLLDEKVEWWSGPTHRDFVQVNFLKFK